MPLVQHALLSLFDLHHKGHFSLEKIVQKTSHAVAERYELRDRGYLREGYIADLALIDLETPLLLQSKIPVITADGAPLKATSLPQALLALGSMVFTCLMVTSLSTIH